MKAALRLQVGLRLEMVIFDVVCEELALLIIYPRPSSNFQPALAYTNYSRSFHKQNILFLLDTGRLSYGLVPADVDSCQSYPQIVSVIPQRNP